ncbi:MAG: hypothetical protein HS116_13735 [Planctomycetes bacterium]|nr:hypothetical protein [Planctomycetota bacterium]
MSKKHGIWLASLLSFALAAQEPRPAPDADPGEEAAPDPDALIPGAVHERVAVKLDASQTYALYLPSYFTPDQTWPILYCFSPGAQGSTPVNLYRAAAERFGWIVVGSNNARNGPMEPVQAAIEALWKDTWTRFPIDPKRLYATGFSGGARMAWAMALTRDKPFAGWLPCGAGYAAEMPPREGLTFAVCGLAGRQDFNYDELNRVERQLAGMGLRTRVLEFDGGHDWPPASHATQAVRYMDLLARVRAGEAGGAAAQDLFQEELADAKAMLEDAHGMLAAHARFAELTELGAGTPIQAEARAALAALDARPGFKKEQLAAARMAELRGELDALTDPAARFERALELYRLFLKEHSGTATAQRVQESLDGLPEKMAFAARLLMRRKDYARAEEILQRALSVLQDPTLAYALACAQARAGKKEAALASLDRAVKLGFGDGAHLQADEDLAALRGEAAYQKLVRELASRAPVPASKP